MTWVDKVWKNRSEGAPTTPVSATGLNDLESRLSTAFDSVVSDTDGTKRASFDIPNIGFDGDSLMVGSMQWDGGDSRAVRGRQPAHLVMFGVDARASFVVVAQGGHTIALRTSAAAADLDPSIDEDRLNILVTRFGTNDLYNEEVDAAGLITRLTTYLTARLAAGWTHAVVSTITPRSNAGTPVDFEADRLAYNALLRAGYADLVPNMTIALADIGDDDLMGQEDDEQSTVFYDGSLVHHSMAGQVRSSWYFKRALQSFGVRVTETAPQKAGLTPLQQTWEVPGIFAPRPFRMFVPASALSPYSAVAPTRVALNPTINMDAWELRANEVSGLAAYVDIPEDWTQFSVDAVFVNNTNPGADDAVLQGIYLPLRVGNNMYSGAVSGSSVTVPLGTYALLQQVELLDQQVPDATAIATKILVLRNGVHASDDSTDSVYLVGLLLRQEP